MAFSGSDAVGFVGLGEMSLELAAALLCSGYFVKAFFQINRPSMDGFMKLGGYRCTSPLEAAKDVSALVVSIAHADQIDKILFGCTGVLKGLRKDTIIMLQSTLSPRTYIQELENHLTEDGDSLFLVDIYVFRGKSEVLNGNIMIASSGSSDSLARARPFLYAMCNKVFILEGEIGAGSKIKMINDLLESIHLVGSAEAICLGAKAGIHPWILYDIILNAAGCSWVFKNHVPLVLKGDHTRDLFLKTFVQNLETVLDAAKSLIFPLPLLSVANQQLIFASSQVHEDVGDAALVKVWEKMYAVSVTDATNTKSYDPEQLAIQITSSSKNVNQIGFIGLGAMGFGMATHLLQSNCGVRGYDSYKPTLSKFENVGGLIGNSPADVSRDVDVLVIMVINEAQVENVLFGEHGAVSALPFGASVIVSSTVSPGFVNQLEQRLQKEGKDLKLVDAPVSGGVKKASMGTLTIMASGTEEALRSSGVVLSALSEKLFVIRGPCGAGSSMKMVNQLLAGIHIASAAEAMSFGARLGLNTRILYDIITNSGGTSWMFENRVPYMLDNDYTPHSALDIFVKDLGIISQESSLRKIPLHVSSMAHQLFVSASSAGWGRKADSAVVEVYRQATGVRVEGKLPILKKDVITQSLPSEWPLDPFQNIQRNSKILIVLDDDPTGTQTVHDIEVLTEWSIDSLIEQFRKQPVCFFILTNSRSLSSEKASALIIDICTNICVAAKLFDNVSFSVVLRGDSTLRGHFPEEADAAVSVLGEMDAWIICPSFLEGGRYTIDDIHYVADSDCLVPAGDTEFAKDASFGYKSSNLREWVEEKTFGRIPARIVSNISIQLIRKGGPEAVCEFLSNLKKGSTCIVNAASQKDMDVFAAGMMLAESKGKHFLCRSAASFVSARIQIIPKAPVLPKNLGINRKGNGGLIVVGSYVSKTTKQVEVLKQQCLHMLRFIEISVEKLALRSIEEREEVINQTVELANIFLRIPKDTVIMTSRELVTGKSPSESLEINFKVGSALVEIVSRITIKPRYILAKGGITSSDIATKALKAKCAKIVGQALAGVPLWQLGSESRHPGVPYIIFPGNVGDSNALTEVVTCWARPERLLSAKEILLSAEKGGYAVGAFNVYNLEGVEAVVAAAEEENSPAILQIHPSALKNAGMPLVACCISAAEQASVPITVHFDHGNSKDELLGVLEMGFDSVMADGSHLPFGENISYTKYITSLAHSKGLSVEAELGRLSGTEDGLTIKDFEARLTDVDEAWKFLVETGIDSLAMCIGNVHGKYPPNGPNLKLDLLKKLHVMCSKAGVFLVLHGASGLSTTLIKGCIEHGVRKLNVNTEVREAYIDSLSDCRDKDVVEVMGSAKMAMKAVVAQKMRLFGSAGKA